MPFQVIYSSQATVPMSVADLEKILVDARAGNERRGVTGVLVYVDGFFLQILEGPKDTVQGLVSSIARDSRHSSLQVFHEAEIAQPLFSTWRMAFVSPTPDQVAAWAGHEGTASIQTILADMQATPGRASQVVRGILGAIAE